MLDFGTPTQRGRTPVPFKIADRVFHGKPFVQGAVLDEVTTSLTRGRVDQGQLLDLFRLFLDTDQYAQFYAFVTGDEVEVPLEFLGVVLEGLLEHYTARPTRPAQPSSAGPGNTGSGSTAGAPSVASTPSSSEASLRIAG